MQTPHVGVIVDYADNYYVDTNYTLTDSTLNGLSGELKFSNMLPYPIAIILTIEN